MPEERPPIGLIPESVSDKERTIDILQAMLRYVDYNKPVPREWVNELSKKMNIRDH